MKTLSYPINRLFFMLLGLFAVITFSSNCIAAKPFRVAIIPFKINSQKDLSFLKAGIVDILSFRLSSENRVIIIESEETQKVLKAFTGRLNETKARKIGRRLNADYVVYGSLTQLRNSISIHAKMMDVSREKPPLVFLNQSTKMDKVIPKINLFATDINKKLSGGFNASNKVFARQNSIRSDMHPIPEKIPANKAKKNIPNPAFIPVNERRSSRKFWQSTDLKHLINGLALGDVDGDGKIETVIMTPHEIHVYRCENNRLYKIKTISKDRHKNHIAVDAADINGNGIAEIFVTSLNTHKNRVNSFVLEYNGKQYDQIMRKRPWYYRIVEVPGQGKVLLGQRAPGSRGPFSGKIVEMTWENSIYKPKKQILPPRLANLRGFAFGDVMNNGPKTGVAYDKNDYIRIIDRTGNVLYTKTEHYGGSNLFFAMPETDRNTENRQYLPMRIQIKDMDSDGKNEIIAVKNHEITGRRLKQFRKFKTSQIESLSWDGSGLAVNWKTPKIAGCISDFAIGDFDNDGRDELIASVILKDGSIVGTTPKSSVIAYDLIK